MSNLPKKEASSERVKLDEILKSLFTVSSKVLINMLNSLFKENYAAEATEVSFASNEFVDDAYNILRGDLFNAIRWKKSKIERTIQNKNSGK